jgi:hypothetical protein
MSLKINGGKNTTHIRWIETEMKPQAKRVCLQGCCKPRLFPCGLHWKVALYFINFSSEGLFKPKEADKVNEVKLLVSDSCI